MTHLNLSFSINWEGRSLSGVEPIARVRERFPQIPVTHFISAAYFARGGDYSMIIDEMLPAFSAHDEVGVLLNTWESIHGTSSGSPAPCTVIRGDDPLLEITHVGVVPQIDSGYTRALSAFPRHHIDAWIRSSRLLLSPLLKQLIQRPGISIDAILRGARAGHSMCSDRVLEVIDDSGFDYDASAVDASWAWRQGEAMRESPFGPWPEMLAALWGPSEQGEGHLANSRCYEATAGTGVDWRSQPFMILSDDERQLLEMPINGGLVPPASPKHLVKIANALAKLPSWAGSYLSFGIHQDTADAEFMKVIEDSLTLVEREFSVQWATLASISEQLLDERPRAGVAPRPPRVPIPSPPRRTRY